MAVETRSFVKRLFGPVTAGTPASANDAALKAVDAVVNRSGNAGLGGFGDFFYGSTHPLRPRLTNPMSGMGLTGDKDQGTGFLPTRLTYAQANTLYQQSWVAAKIIDIPVDDMLIRGWRFKDSGKKEETMKQAERDYKLHKKLSQAMKAARLHGSSVIIIVMKDQQHDQPLDLDKVKEGDLVNLIVADRWSLVVENWQKDVNKKDYGEPYQYRYTPRIAESGDMIVHKSRMVRFDGKKPVNTEGWFGDAYNREWGISELLPALDEIHRDAAIHAGIGHMVQEASIFVMKMERWNDVVKGRVPPGEPTLKEIGETTNLMKSLFRTMYVDQTTDVQRLAIQFSGIDRIAEITAKRCAAIADIPTTRFLSESPAGLNATGQGDFKNYAVRVSALQKRMLDEPLGHTLHPIIARSAGLKEAPEYEWVPFADLSDEEKARVSQSRSSPIIQMYQAGGIDENELRSAMAADDFLFPEGLESWNDAVLEERMEKQAAGRGRF